MTDDPSETAAPWRPLGYRADPELAAEYDDPAEGVPSWLESSLYEWCSEMIAWSSAVLPRLERRLRRVIGTGRGDFMEFWEYQADDNAKLEVTDALLKQIQDLNRQTLSAGRPDQARTLLDRVGSLSEQLEEAGSAWSVGGAEHWGLVRRVNDASKAQYEAVVSIGSDAARKIGSAWHNCYKMHPDHDTAYRDAVLAVEAVVLPAMIRNDNDGTLGKAIGHLKNTTAQWSVAGLDDPKQASGDTLLAMLRTLWHNQPRHANNDSTISGASREEAEAAVSLAVTLVHWFSSGLVQKDGNPV